MLVFSCANAAVIFQPMAIAVSSPDPVSRLVPGSIIDQSGLSASYASGVTSFATFTSSTKASHTLYGGDLFSTVGGVGGLGSFYLDLGALLGVNSVATWGQDNGTATVLSYDLYYSDTFGAGGSKILIGRFSAESSPDAVAHTFTTVNARYLELDVVSNEGFTSASRLNEIAFGGGVAVPEPSSILPFLLGSLGMLRRRRNC